MSDQEISVTPEPEPNHPAARSKPEPGTLKPADQEPTEKVDENAPGGTDPPPIAVASLIELALENLAGD